MKILIAGGAGYIGSHVAVALSDAGHEPLIVDNLSNASIDILDRIAAITGTRPTFYHADVRDKDALAQICEKEQPIDGIIHFAGYKAVGESVKKPLKYYDNNVISVLRLLEIAQQYRIKHVLFSSSATVYGDPISNPIPETAHRQPATNPYGNTKAIAEDIIRDATISGQDLKAISLRYFNPIGAHPSGHIGEHPSGTPANLVPYLTQVAAGLREKLFIFGDDYDTIDGTGVRDFIHVVDLANAHIATIDFLLKKDTMPFYDVYNVGTGTGTSVKELITTFERVNHVPVPYAIKQRRAGDIAACWADPSKIQKDMGWHAEKTLEDALRDAWRWQQHLTP